MKLTVVWWGATTPGMLQPGKSGKQDYGGQLRKKMRRSIVNSVAYVNEWVSPLR